LSITLFFHILDFNDQIIDLTKIRKKQVSKELNSIKHKEASYSKTLDRNRNNKQNNSVILEPIKNKDKSKDYYNETFENNISLAGEEMKIQNTAQNRAVSKLLDQNGDNIIQITLEENKENNFEELLKTQGDRNKKSNKPDTPKFNKEKNVNIKKIPKVEDTHNSEQKTILNINKKLDDMKNKHCFLPSNDYLNVVHNTVEICHRKFFELCFEETFKKIIHINKDKFGIIKIEEIIAFFT